MTQSVSATAARAACFSDALGPTDIPAPKPVWKPRWVRMPLRAQWANPDFRARRVNMFLLAIVFLSLADLAMTLDHMVGPGMYESNPLARFILHWGSPATLAMFKCMTLLLGTWLLWRTRKSAASEIGAIICMVALTWLMVRWNHYSNEMTALTPHLAEIQMYNSESWVAITSDP
jgi:hypothetical protein